MIQITPEKYHNYSFVGRLPYQKRKKNGAFQLVCGDDCRLCLVGTEVTGSAGGSAVFDDRGQSLHSVHDAHVGDTLHLRFTDGSMDAAVKEIHPEEEPNHD